MRFTVHPAAYRVVWFDTESAVVRIWLDIAVTAQSPNGPVNSRSMSFADWSIGWTDNDWRLNAMGDSVTLSSPELPAEAKPYEPPAPTDSFG